MPRYDNRGGKECHRKLVFCDPSLMLIIRAQESSPHSAQKPTPNYISPGAQCLGCQGTRTSQQASPLTHNFHPPPQAAFLPWTGLIGLQQRTPHLKLAPRYGPQASSGAAQSRHPGLAAEGRWQGGCRRRLSWAGTSAPCLQPDREADGSRGD